MFGFLARDARYWRIRLLRAKCLPRNGPCGADGGAGGAQLIGGRQSHLVCCSRATPLRKGKWTPEEEAFTSRIIHDFTNGYLPLAPGTTLRSYLSEKLNWWVKYSNFEFCATRI